MPWKSLATPRKDTVDLPGMCLRFAQSFFGAPVAYPDAWTAWENQKHRHPASEPLPSVPVVLWFSHYGSYGSPGQEYWKNWGHVAPYVPGDAIYSSPATWNAGWSQSRFATIADLERALNCKYVGWSEDLNGMRLAQRVASPVNEAETETAPKIQRKKNMATLYCQSANNKRPGQGAVDVTWFLAGDSPGTPANWLGTKDQTVANGWAGAHGSAVWLTQKSINSFRKVYLSPLNTTR